MEGKGEMKREPFHAGGHFYNLIPDPAELMRNAARIFDRSKRELGAIDLRGKEQRKLLESLVGFYQDQPFPETERTATRYYCDYDYFPHQDCCSSAL
jgi:hypothetical protein